MLMLTWQIVQPLLAITSFAITPRTMMNSSLAKLWKRYRVGWGHAGWAMMHGGRKELAYVFTRSLLRATRCICQRAMCFNNHLPLICEHPKWLTGRRLQCMRGSEKEARSEARQRSSLGLGLHIHVCSERLESFPWTRVMETHTKLMGLRACTCTSLLQGN